MKRASACGNNLLNFPSFISAGVDCGASRNRREKKIVIASRLAVWQRCRWVDVASFEDNFQLVVVIFSSSMAGISSFGSNESNDFPVRGGPLSSSIVCSILHIFSKRISFIESLSYGCFIFLYYFIFDTNHTLDRVSAITHYITSFISQVVFSLISLSSCMHCTIVVVDVIFRRISRENLRYAIANSRPSPSSSLHLTVPIISGEETTSHKWSWDELAVYNFANR